MQLRQQLLRISRNADKLLTKAIIVTSFFVCVSNYSFSQTDTSAFKKDFEKLLSKYGLSNKSYMINVNSINQKGGQTAFIINNNFYGDTTSEKNNLFYVFDTVSNHVTLIAAPLKGTWTNPYVLADTSNMHRYVNIGAGFYSHVSAQLSWVVDKWCYLGGIITPYAVSYYSPFYIELKDNTPDQYFVFGDYLDPNKTFLFYKGKIQYWGMFTEEQFKKIPPPPIKKDIEKEKKD